MKKEIPIKKNEINKGERYFEIRDVDKDGCGSCMTYCVNKNETDDNIFNLACELQTELMNKKEEEYIPSFFRQPPKWRNTIKIIEMTRKILPPKKWEIENGRDYRNEWITKRCGLKFKIYNSWLKLTTICGKEYCGNGYKFDKII